MRLRRSSTATSRRRRPRRRPAVSNLPFRTDTPFQMALSCSASSPLPMSERPCSLAAVFRPSSSCPASTPSCTTRAILFARPASKTTTRPSGSPSALPVGPPPPSPPTRSSYQLPRHLHPDVFHRESRPTDSVPDLGHLCHGDCHGHGGRLPLSEQGLSTCLLSRPVQ